MFRDAADALRGAGFYQAALRYYEPLQQVSGYADISYYVDLAFCYKSVGHNAEAEACYSSIMELERERSSTRIRLSPDASEVAVVGGTAFDVMDRTPAPYQPFPSSEGIGLEISSPTSTSRTAALSAMLIPRPSKLSSKRRNADKRFQMQLREEKTRTLYGRTQELLEKARSGDVEVLPQWMTAAQELVDDFRSHRGFYPFHRSLKTYEQSKLSVIESLKYRVDQAMQDIVGHAGRPPGKRILFNLQWASVALMSQLDDLASDPAVIAGDFRGIPFSAWLDLMLEYSMLLAQSHEYSKAYEILRIANGANVFNSSPDCTFLIHVCWFSKSLSFLYDSGYSITDRHPACALIADDEETSCIVARWFMKEFQFVTDGYRLFCTINRLCIGQNTWFNCGPTQKFVRRQLKAMDCSLVDQNQRRELYQEKASYTTRDDEGRSISAGDMDLALLMLYGYMLYLGKSFALSLSMSILPL